MPVGWPHRPGLPATDLQTRQSVGWTGESAVVGVMPDTHVRVCKAGYPCFERRLTRRHLQRVEACHARPGAWNSTAQLVAAEVNCLHVHQTGPLQHRTHARAHTQGVRHSGTRIATSLVTCPGCKLIQAHAFPRHWLHALAANPFYCLPAVCQPTFTHCEPLLHSTCRTPSSHPTLP
jgi:hypothetical protein